MARWLVACWVNSESCVLHHEHITCCITYAGVFEKPWRVLTMWIQSRFDRRLFLANSTSSSHKRQVISYSSRYNPDAQSSCIISWTRSEHWWWYLVRMWTLHGYFIHGRRFNPWRANMDAVYCMDTRIRVLTSQKNAWISSVTDVCWANVARYCEHNSKPS